MIHFKKARWKNFLSTGNQFTEVQLDRSRSTLIVGANGAGKTTFLDAIVFALYGEAYRNIKKGALVNSINGRDCVVEVEFDTSNHSYLVRRGIKPNIFEVFQDGILINQEAANSDYQENLEKNIIKMSLKSFLQIVVLGITAYEPFMKLKSNRRREVIEDILDIQIFTSMSKQLKGRIDESKEKLATIKSNITSLTTEIAAHERVIAQFETSQRKQQDDVDVKIAAAREMITDLQARHESVFQDAAQLNDSLADEDLVRNEAQAIYTKMAKATERVFSLKKELDFYEQNENCSKCKQPIDGEFKAQMHAEHTPVIEGLCNVNAKLLDKYKGLQRRIAEYEQTRKELDKLHLELRHIQHSIDRQGDYIVTLLEQTEASDNSATIEQERAAMVARQDELAALRDEYNTAVADHEVLQYCSVLLRDTGIRATIIKQYIPIINHLINKYLHKMEFFCQFELDEQFNETIKSRYRDEFTYESFSEGEKQRIDKAILFAWISVARLRNSQSTNLLVIDELFDSSLDSVGVDDVLRIFEEMEHNQNLFVISHRGDQLYEKFHSVIKFEKSKNFSYITRG